MRAHSVELRSASQLKKRRSKMAATIDVKHHGTTQEKMVQSLQNPAIINSGELGFADPADFSKTMSTLKTSTGRSGSAPIKQRNIYFDKVLNELLKNVKLTPGLSVSKLDLGLLFAAKCEDLRI